MCCRRQRAPTTSPPTNPGVHRTSRPHTHGPLWQGGHARQVEQRRCGARPSACALTTTCSLHVCARVPAACVCRRGSVCEQLVGHGGAPRRDSAHVCSHGAAPGGYVRRQAWHCAARARMHARRPPLWGHRSGATALGLSCMQQLLLASASAATWLPACLPSCAGRSGAYIGSPELGPVNYFQARAMRAGLVGRCACRCLAAVTPCKCNRQRSILLRLRLHLRAGGRDRGAQRAARALRVGLQVRPPHRWHARACAHALVISHASTCLH